MIADGANGGVDNVTYHHYLTEGEASGEMRLYRAKLNNFSGGTKEIKLKGSYPSEMVLRQGTDITVVGLTPEGKAIVSFDEGFKRGGSDMAPRSEPKLYFVVMPYEAKDAKPGETSVENLFIENNLVFKDGKISFQKVQGGKTYTWTPNRIDAKMVEALREEAGILWVDKSKDGKFITNPIVPEPSKELVGDKYEVKQDENGDVIAIDGSGKKLAIAKWSEVKEEWEWGPAIPPTPTVLPTPTATKVPEMKPYETKTYSGTANTESKLLNESNISSFYSFVTKEEAQKLAREQDGKLLFPLSPKGQFSMGEYTMNWDGSKIIVAYSSNLDIIAPFDGTVEVSPNGVRVKSNKKGPDGSYYVATFGAYESNLEINLKTGDQAKTGEKMFKFLGSKPAKIDGDMAEANRFTFDIGRWLDYNPPLIIPGGGTKTREVTKITPSLLGKELLVLGKDGKPVIEQ
ncbi:hypothetical protein M1307_03445 [Patescibacteria group bacterium]|nr:hypothetical protein [Patescibacteria group bacterium]